MATTTIAVSRETRTLLKSLKTKGETYDDVIRFLVVTHPARLASVKICERLVDAEPEGPIQDLVAKSRMQPY